MDPKSRVDESGTYVFDEDALDDIEGVETTAVLREHGAHGNSSDTAELEGLDPVDGFLDDIDAPSLSGLFKTK